MVCPRVTWDGWQKPDERTRRQDSTGRRRFVRHKRHIPAEGNRQERGQFDPDQGQPDWHGK